MRPPIAPALNRIRIPEALVPALIDGTKTLFSFPVFPQPPTEAKDAGVIHSSNESHGEWSWLDSPNLEEASCIGYPFRCPYGVAGDHLVFTQASDLLLEIVSVRITRLHDISEIEAQQHGVARTRRHWKSYDSASSFYRSARRSMQSLWDTHGIHQLSHAGKWVSNPWIWLIETQKPAKGPAA